MAFFLHIYFNTDNITNSLDVCYDKLLKLQIFLLIFTRLIKKLSRKMLPASKLLCAGWASEMFRLFQNNHNRIQNKLVLQKCIMKLKLLLLIFLSLLTSSLSAGDRNSAPSKSVENSFSSFPLLFGLNRYT